MAKNWRCTIRDFQIKKYPIALKAREQGVGSRGGKAVVKSRNWIIYFLEFPRGLFRTLYYPSNSLLNPENLWLNSLGLIFGQYNCFMINFKNLQYFLLPHHWSLPQKASRYHCRNFLRHQPLLRVRVVTTASCLDVASQLQQL